MRAILAALLLSSPAYAQEAASKIGMGLAVFGGLVQLGLGIGLAVVSISLGIRILDRVMPDVKVISSLQAGNRAVGIMTAGVVIAYTKVISTGIVQIGESVSVAPSIPAFLGGLINVGIGIALASIGVTWAFKALSRATPQLDLTKELNADNIGVGIFVAGVLYGISEMIAAAVSGVGQSLASAFQNLL